MGFTELYKIDVSSYVEKKGRLSYLSWSYAWAEFKKVYPFASYEVIENKDGWNYHTDGRTAWVKVRVNNGAEECCHTEMLPVMDNYNKSIPIDKITSMDVNKAIKRCLAKCIALYGLGLYIYNGEDLPEDANTVVAKTAPAVQQPKVATGEKPENVITCEVCGKRLPPDFANKSRAANNGHVFCSGTCKNRFFFDEMQVDGNA